MLVLGVVSGEEVTRVCVVRTLMLRLRDEFSDHGLDDTNVPICD